MGGMDSLFKKLNTLVRAGLNDLLGEDWAAGDLRRRLLPGRLGPDIDREIATLRQRIEEALGYEDQLQARVDALYAEVAELDAQADQEVQAGHEDEARRAVEELQRKQRELNMAEADLREHRLVTQDLIFQVNRLEAVVEEARRAQQEAAEQTEEQGVSDVLRSARQQADHDTAAAPEPSAEDHTAGGTADTQAVDDDLSQRVARLSKRSGKKE